MPEPVSNRKRLPREVPPGIAATARAARCSDCAGRAQARYRNGAWTVKFWHSGGCPSYTGTTRGTLHRDAEASVRRAASQSGLQLAYGPVGAESGFVSGSGLVTASGAGT